SLLTLSLRNKRDVLLARQRARQIAGLLGFDPPARLAIAARAFEIAWTSHRQGDGQAIVFQIEDQVLTVFNSCPSEHSIKSPSEWPKHDPSGVERLMKRLSRLPPTPPLLRLEIALPSPVLSVDDAVWATRQLSRQTPLNLFEEIHQQNLEMLRL